MTLKLNGASSGHVTLDAKASAASNTLTLPSTANGELVAADSSGNITISNGNLIVGTAGKGIDFSATTDGTTMGSELLDDYEEGTFTPAYGQGVDAGFGYANQDGAYVKIGKIVYWEIYINGSSGSSNSSSLYIYGFPFTVDTGNARGGATAAWHQYASDYQFYMGNPSSPRLFFYDGNSAVSGNTVLASGDAAHLYGSYRAA